MAGIAVLLIIFCIGVFALLAWFAVTITSEGGVKKIVNSITNQESSSKGRRFSSRGDYNSSDDMMLDRSLNPMYSILPGNINHHDDYTWK